MSGPQATGKSIAIELGRVVTRKVAPEEYPFYDELLAASKAPPRRAKDRSLGFGVESFVDSAVSVAIFEVCKSALRFIWLNARDPLGQLIKQMTADAANEMEKQFK